MFARRVISVVVLATLAIIATASTSSATIKTPVSVQVQLNTTTIRAGHSIHGTAILTNASSTSIFVQGWDCGKWLFIGLANKNVAYDPAVATSACSNSVTLKPGANRVPITVSTQYQVCAGAGPGTREVPRCTKVGMPALPKGTYHVVVITNGLSEFASYSAQLRVTIS
jgi:hypothetical protein